MAVRETLLDRFCRYVRIDTQSSGTSTTYPSTERQLDLLRLLVGELKALGLDDAAVDEHGYVTATLPATPGGEKVPARHRLHRPRGHLSRGVSGENVVPTFHANYRGGDIALPKNGIVIKAAARTPTSRPASARPSSRPTAPRCSGADDKAGIAEIMEALTRILENPGFAHGPVKVAFTPDEEVGARRQALRRRESSAPRWPTPWTAASAARSRTRPSAPTPRSSPSPAATSTPATPRTS